MRYLFALVLCVSSLHAQTLSGLSLGNIGDLHGWQPGTSASPWRVDITSMAIDSTNAAWKAEVAGTHLHPDFGGNGGYGIPYTVVDNSTPNVAIGMHFPTDQNDSVQAPIPSNIAVEGGQSCPTSYQGDSHAIVINKDTGWMHEFFVFWVCPSGYSSEQQSVFDTTIDEQRVGGTTSADASGMSLFSGLIKYEELQSGVMAHATRYTMTHTLCGHYPNGQYGDSAFVLPALHGSCNSGGTNNIMGMRLRLPASFDETPYSAHPRLIALLHAWKTYGLMLTDNGSNGFISGTQDARWDDNELNLLKNITLDQFDVMQLGTQYTADNLPTGPAPTISGLTASRPSVHLGECATLSWTSSGSSYEYVENGQPSRTQNSVVCPTQTSSYLVQASNLYGRTASNSATVKVLVPPIQGGRFSGSPLKH